MSSPLPPARNRRTLLLLAALFFVPVGLAFALYYGQSWRPQGQTNHGELFRPARPLPEVSLPELALEDPAAPTPPPPATPAPQREPALRGKWALAYVATGPCEDACRQALLVMRQTRLALNREMTRVDRVLLVADRDCCDRAFLAREHAGLRLLDASGPEAAAVLAVFAGSADGGAPWIHVVDPLGNLVLRYDANDPPKGFLEDLKKLLKLSHIG